MPRGSRDEFNERTKNTVAQRVGFKCSNPECGVQTYGPNQDDDRSVNIGVAAHICAAAKGGPRYDAGMTPVQRASIKNAIWLCHNCSKRVDSDEKKFTVDILRGWKKEAEKKASSELGLKALPTSPPSDSSINSIPLRVLNDILHSMIKMKSTADGLFECRNHFNIQDNPDDNHMVYEQGWNLLRESKKLFKIEEKWGLQLRKLFGHSLTEGALALPPCMREDYYGEEAVSRTSMAYLSFFLSDRGANFIRACEEIIKKISSLITEQSQI